MKNLKKLNRKEQMAIIGAGCPPPSPNYCNEFCGGPSGGIWIPSRCTCLCTLEP
ncbi:bacteriocin-like protein [Chryseobacterium sp. MIQD13]|uniref:bacteriocin-like protein n=1 Tax=Chryseobacterium sp. MIQD13 TaxID=3422310 RepID=UPI003D2E93A5